MDLSQPLRLQFAGIAHRSVIVAVKIPTTDRVPVVDVVVHFGDSVVRTDAVGKAEVDRGGAGRVGAQICGETGAVAGDWGPKVHPPICRLAGLTGIPPACKS